MDVSLLSVLLTPLTLFGAATSADTFHWSGHVTAGQRIEVRGINGSIHAQPASGESVDVIAYKSGREIDPAAIGVKVVESDGGAMIFAIPQNAPGSAEYTDDESDLTGDADVRFHRQCAVGRALRGAHGQWIGGSEGARRRHGGPHREWRRRAEHHRHRARRNGERIDHGVDGENR